MSKAMEELCGMDRARKERAARGAITPPPAWSNEPEGQEFLIWIARTLMDVAERVAQLEHGQHELVDRWRRAGLIPADENAIL